MTKKEALSKLKGEYEKRDFYDIRSSPPAVVFHRSYWKGVEDAIAVIIENKNELDR